MGRRYATAGTVRGYLKSGFSGTSNSKNIYNPRYPAMARGILAVVVVPCNPRLLAVARWDLAVVVLPRNPRPLVVAR